MTFFVLGSNSFTGSHFVDYVLTNTDHAVVGVSRSPEYPSVMLPYLYQKKVREDRFRFHQLNLVSELPQVLELIDSVRPDFIVNFAAQGEVRNSWNWPEQWFTTNALAVVRLSSALVGKPFLKKYVAISTPEVYGATGLMQRENQEYRPSSPYATSKLAGDLHLMSLVKRYGFPATFTRSANVYGIHQQFYRIIPKVILSIKKKKRIQLHGRGEAVRSFIHVRDVADATFRVCLDGRPGEVYHIAPQTPGLRIADLVSRICRLMDEQVEDCVDLVEENFGQDALYSLNSEKIRAELSWQDQISLEAGVQEVGQWIAANWQELSQMPVEYRHMP